MSNKKQLSKRQYWLTWKLIESLRARQVQFEGRDNEFTRDFDELRDICLDRAFDYDPAKDK